MSTTSTTTISPWNIITTLGSATASYNSTFSIPVFFSSRQTTPLSAISIGVEYSTFDFECLGVSGIHPQITTTSFSGCEPITNTQSISKVRFGWFDSSTQSTVGVSLTASSEYSPVYKLFDLNFRAYGWGDFPFNFELPLSEYASAGNTPSVISNVSWSGVTISVSSPFTQSFTTTTSTTTQQPSDYTIEIGNISTFLATFSIPVYIHPNSPISQFIKIAELETNYFWSNQNLECTSVDIIDDQLKSWTFSSITKDGVESYLQSIGTSSGYFSDGISYTSIGHSWFTNRSLLGQVGSTTSSIELLVYTSSTHLYNINFSYKNVGSYTFSGCGVSKVGTFQTNLLTGETFSVYTNEFQSCSPSIRAGVFTQSLTPSILSTLDTYYLGGGGGISPRSTIITDGSVLNTLPIVYCQVNYNKFRRLLRRHDFNFYGSWTLSSPTYSGYSFSFGPKPPVSSYLINTSSINTIPGSSSSVSIFTFSIPGTFSFGDMITIHAGTTQSSYNRNSTDALQIAKFFAQIDTPTQIERKASDINLNNIVNSTDALQVQRRFVNIINTFPGGEWVLHPGTFSLSQLSITQSSGSQYLYLPITVCNMGQLRP